MSASRGRGLRPGGVVRALLRLLVLVAIGFGVGLIFGVVTEEPELLAGHLRGESQSISLDSEPSRLARTTDFEDTGGSNALQGRPTVGPTAASVTVPLPPVASSRSTAEAAPRATARSASARGVRVASASESTRHAMRSPPGWSIQVGAFSEQSAASRLADGLRDRYPVEVLPASGKADRWRVRVQPIRSEERAREMAEQLKRDDRLPTWVTPMEGRPGS